MKKILYLSVLLTLTIVHDLMGTEMWFRPVDGFSWQSTNNWLTGGSTAMNRTPGIEDDVLLSSSRIPTGSPLSVTGTVTAVCRRLIIGELYNNGAHPAVAVSGRLSCNGTNDDSIICIGNNGNGTLLLRGGDLTFGNTKAIGRNLRIRMDSTISGTLRGWGSVNPNPDVTNVRMINNGQVIADGEGLPRDLDLHGVVSTTNSLANGVNGTNGWYAVNQGRLLYPRSWKDCSSTPNGMITLGDVPNKVIPEMVNSLRVTLTGMSGYVFLRGGLYATNHPSLPALPKGECCLGVWNLGLYKNNTGWTVADSATFQKASLTIRYDATHLGTANRLALYRYENSKWMPTGTTASGRLISTTSTLSEMKGEDFNIGLFALMASTNNGTLICLKSELEKDPNTRLVIDKNLPAGNISLLSVDGDTVHLDNELRDTNHDWFYWAFRACGAQGRTMKFVFNHRSPVCTRGPCVSLDKGVTWTYTADSFTERAFTYTFPSHAKEVWFAMGMVYTQRDWEAFLARHTADSAYIETNTLCISKRGRAVEKARFGCISQTPTYQIWLSARHHAQEMMASYVLEGILDAVLADTDLGRWMRSNVEFMVVPFVDKDGVEDGDQGKYRSPHDHNRDYDEFLYSECRGITNWIISHCGTADTGKLKIVLDIHCPWIRGTYNEWLYQVYTKNTNNATAQKKFGMLLEANQRGSMDYKQANDLPFGQSWNTENNYSQGRSFKFWVIDYIPSAKLVTTYEVPFATANSATVTRETCREFGEDTTKVFKILLEDKEF